MKKILLLTIGIIWSMTIRAQDWVNNAEKLYYYGDEGKVYLQPDYSSSVVYFSRKPSVNIKEQMLTTIKNARPANSTISEKSFKMMETKDMMEIKSMGTLPSIKTKTERINFLESFQLKAQGAYDVLPKFEVNGNHLAFTKKIIISLKKGQTLEHISELLNQYEAVYLRNTLDEQTMVLEISKIENQLPLIQAIYDQGLLEWGQPDFTVEISHFDDPLYPEQFQMNNTGGTLDGSTLVSDIDIDAPEAWAITKGSSSITVAMIDDGLESHPDLPTITAGYTPATEGSGTPLSDGAHGVSCAGIVAAQHNDIGVRGVAPNVNLLSVNIFTDQETVQDLADAFTWAMNQGADVISNSWGFSGSCSSNLYPAITTAINNAATNGRDGLGCVIVFASGNDYGTCISYPSTLSSVIAVGAVSPDGGISLYSNQGSLLDVVAPSNDVNTAVTAYIYGVRTTDRTGSNGYESGNYTTTFGGTSAACPSVSGVAALVLSVDPTLTSSEVYNIITSTADDMGSTGFDNTFGYGRVNAYEAVLAAGGISCELAAPASLSSSAVTDSTFSLSWSSVSGAASYTVTVDGTSITTTSTSYIATGLESGTTYSCSVVANCTAGGSGDAVTVSVTTTGDTPDCTPETIDTNHFDSVWGIWNDGGTDCASSTTYGAYSIRLRDNTSTSNMYTDALNLSSYSEITIDFNFIMSSMETGEDFFLEYSTNGGSSYTTMGNWISGSGGYTNGSWYSESVTVEATFTSNTVFRFRCDASDDNDYVYIDDVIISGCGISTSSTVASPALTSTVDLLSGETFDLSKVSIYPNPVNQLLYVEHIPSGSSVKLIDISGQVLIRSSGNSPLDMRSLSSGLYILQISSEGETHSFNVVKK